MLIDEDLAAIKAALSDDSLWDVGAAVDDTYVAVNALRNVSGPAALRAIVEYVERLEAALRQCHYALDRMLRANEPEADIMQRAILAEATARAALEATK